MKKLFFTALVIGHLWISNALWAQQERSANPDHQVVPVSLAANGNTTASFFNIHRLVLSSATVSINSPSSTAAPSHCAFQIHPAAQATPVLWLLAKEDFYFIDNRSICQLVKDANRLGKTTGFVGDDVVQWMLHYDEDLDNEGAKTMATQLINQVKKQYNSTGYNKQVFDYESYLDYMDKCHVAMQQKEVGLANTR